MCSAPTDSMGRKHATHATVAWGDDDGKNNRRYVGREGREKERDGERAGA